MKKFIFILGGARSGKSTYAVELAKKFREKVVFIATAAWLDEEMRERVKRHQISRPRRWKLIEEGRDVSSILPELNGKCEVILVDCLGLLVSNLLADDLEDKEIERRLKRLIKAILKVKFTTILVSNEVGEGIIPDNPLTRRFRDLLGWANQMMAKEADEVIFMRSGIPVKIKNSK